MILWMVVVNGVVECIVGCDGFLFIFVVLYFIWLKGIDGGLILLVSYNSGGLNVDFGLKFNSVNGGFVFEVVIEEIYVCI